MTATLHSIKLDAKYLLELKDDWDDEGAKAYTPEHVARASTLAESLCFLAHAKAPCMNPAEKDSIDLFWNKDGVGHVLINVPPSLPAAFSCGFYEERVYGQFDSTHPATVLKFLIQLMGYDP